MLIDGVNPISGDLLIVRAGVNTVAATIAAIGKPRPASGSLKKNILAKDLRRFRVTRPFDSRRGASRRVVSTRDGE